MFHVRLHDINSCCDQYTIWFVNVLPQLCFILFKSILPIHAPNSVVNNSTKLFQYFLKGMSTSYRGLVPDNIRYRILSKSIRTQQNCRFPLLFDTLY